MAEHLVVLCPVCSTAAYRSKQPLESGDRIKAVDFYPLSPSYPQPMDGQPLLCPECGGVMKMMLESAARKIVESGPTETINAPADQRSPSRHSSMTEHSALTREVPGQSPGGGTNSSETLFAVGAGEEIKSIKEMGSMVVVITNKRIERISL